MLCLYRLFSKSLFGQTYSFISVFNLAIRVFVVPLISRNGNYIAVSEYLCSMYKTQDGYQGLSGLSTDQIIALPFNTFMFVVFMLMFHYSPGKTKQR